MAKTTDNYKVISTEALIAKFKQAIAESWGYIWGTHGEMWTSEKQQKLEQTTDADREKGRLYGSKWIGHMVTDCSGLFYWAFKQLGNYIYHGSNTIWNKYCTYQGDLKNGQRTDGQSLKPGTAVFTKKLKNGKWNRGHIGLYIGDGWVIEAQGTIEGVKKSKVTLSKWVEWGELKGVNYSISENIAKPPMPTTPEPVAKQYPTLRRGARGDNVRKLQTYLHKSGSSLAIDGIFGPVTESSVRTFQRKYNLKIDGIVGPQTWKKLKELYIDKK